MNPDANEVFPDSEDYQLSFTCPYNSQDNDIPTVSPSQDNDNPTVSPSQDDDIPTVSPPGQTEGFSEEKDHVSYVTQSRSSYQPAVPPVHPTSFFYRPPKDFYHYYVNCEEIPYDTIEILLKKLFSDKENVLQ